MGKTCKNTKIRQIHPSSIFFACPSETPEGQFVGITLNFSMLAEVSIRNQVGFLFFFLFLPELVLIETSANILNSKLFQQIVLQVFQGRTGKKG